MTRRLASAFLVGVVAWVTLMSDGEAFAQDSVAAARDLYTAAAYTDALAALNRLQAGEHAREESRAIELYRGLCLLALGRATEADQAFETIIAREPMYRPSESDVSPRVRSLFTDVRRRVLPAIVQKRYALAKAAFDRKEFASAGDGFKQVLDELADPDVTSAANQSPLSDLRVLAAGFHDLSASAAAPPPPPPPAPPAPVPSLRPEPRIYGAGDASVAAPVTLWQPIPSFPGRVRANRGGAVEVIVDETGAVESAAITVSMDAQYDPRVLSAARTWRYKPAMLGDVPVKYRKLIQIIITSPPETR